MKICGIQKTTLLDYPGHLAASVFLGGCNFKCPYCHNSDLVLDYNSMEGISPESLFQFLEKRRDILEGVCITGGEPTISRELPLLLEKIKGMGYLVKLDTNGYKPDILGCLIKNRLVDYIAMDLKNSLEDSGKTAGMESFSKESIHESILLIQNSGLKHEFRTTVVKEFHGRENLRLISELAIGSPYFLQRFQENDKVMCHGYHGYEAEEMIELAEWLGGEKNLIFFRG